ncbi:MAG: hypothetical protein K5790_01585 [Nitrosopumilus sp.]|uniref:cupredoxin domain-containing protein n=1 Tax=Nitrosopumilus sp. TaxID=2024843 RepID=UPI00247D8DEA|nr:hypothetical protein [Nitrosopumilus sp.]MCV0391965.1 hypothetical protein [Nitrosopumilus sp.]
MKTSLLIIAVLILLGLFVASFFIVSSEGIFLPLRIFIDGMLSDYDDSVRKANYDASDVLDCNDEKNPYNEYECFRDAFSNCYNAIVNPEIYTIEGDPIYTTLKITPECTIQGTADTSTDRFAVPEIITTECLSVGRGGYTWSVGACDAKNLPEMQFNFEMQLYPLHILESESAKEIAIENIKESILTDTSYEQWRQTIQKEVDEKNLGYFSQMMITDLKDELEQDEIPSFSLITFGYRDWCIMPSILVYHQDHEEPIYEHQIVHTCPAPDGNPNPYISIRDESDFGTFPLCQFEGQYTIWGKSFEFGPKAIGSFYCNSSEKFRAPETFEIIIPQGSSNLDVKNNFVPSELEIRYGDSLKITNKDNSIHDVILFINKHDDTAVFGIRVNPGESFVETVYRFGTFELISWDENEKEYPWMHGVVSVTEK